MSRYRSPRVVIALVMLMALTSFATPATAAPAPLTGVGVILYDIGFGKVPTLVITGILAEDVDLPATVEVPVPGGSTVGWVGEVFGGDQSQDFVASFTTRAEDGYDVLEIEVTKSRVVQVELEPPAGWVVEKGTTADLSMSWIAHQDLPSVLVGFELDKSIHAENPAPASLATTVTASGVRYSYETEPVAAGTTLTLTATLADGADPIVAAVAGAEDDAAAPEQATIQPSAGPSVEAIVVGVLGAVVIALLIALGVLIRRQKTPPKA